MTELNSKMSDQMTHRELMNLKSGIDGIDVHKGMTGMLVVRDYNERKIYVFVHAGDLTPGGKHLYSHVMTNDMPNLTR